MKFTFITEKNMTGKISEKNPIWNFDILLQYALDANHIPISRVHGRSLQASLNEIGEVFIIIPPKTTPFTPADLTYLHRIKPTAFCVIMQEGTRYQWQDQPPERIQEYVELYTLADAILVHSENDKRFFRAFNSLVLKVPTMIHLEDVQKRLRDPATKDNSLFINGNFISEYNFPFQLEVARQTNYNMFIPTVSSLHKEDYKAAPDVIQLQYYPYQLWLPLLSRFKIVLNIANFFGAGSQSLMCAALGIPCIGSVYSENHKTLFPKLSTRPYTFEAAKNILKELIENEEFYNEVRDFALEKIKDYDYKCLVPEFKKTLQAQLKLRRMELNERNNRSL